MINEEHGKIYNDYLKAIGNASNRPYKPRKDFSKLDDGIKTILHRLELFFAQYKHISPYNFFIASLRYREKEFLPIDEFLKYSAIVAYSRWNKEKYDLSIEDDTSVEDFIGGLRFILSFCVENKLTLKEYRTSRNNMYVPWVLLHLNEQRISFYHIHAMDISLSDIKTDYTDITFNDFDGMFHKTKQKYINSKRIKELGNKILNEINRK